MIVPTISRTPQPLDKTAIGEIECRVFFVGRCLSANDGTLATAGQLDAYCLV
jgi:hypothetical protein